MMLSAIEERVRVLCPFQHDHIISYIASERAPGIIHTLPYLSLRYLFLLLLLILLLHIPYPSTSLPLPLLPSLLHLSSCTPLSSSLFLMDSFRFSDTSTVYIFSEFHSVTTISSLLQNFGSLDIVTLSKYAVQILEALAFLNSHGFSHGTTIYIV